MISEAEVSLSEIIALRKKGGNMTLNDKSNMEFMMNAPASHEIVSVRCGNKDRRLSDDETKFVSHVFSQMVKWDLEKLEQIMMVYGFDLDTVFYCEDTELSEYNPNW